MRASVDELALRFRVPRGSANAAAQLSALERLMHARLPTELAAAIESVRDNTSEVLVVREAIARVSLRAADRALDHALLERTTAAARDAVVGLLQQAADDEQVQRFPSESAFAGAFVVEVLDATAWNRWWFAPFRRFRRAEVRDTLVALLADAETDCSALFARLERRGRLADLLALVGPTAVRQLALVVDSVASGPVPPELAPLAAAGFAIAESLDVSVESTRQRALAAEYYNMHGAPPSWLHRDALTQWVWEFARWVVLCESPDASAPSLDDARRTALDALLSGPLDWLDGEWISEQAKLGTSGASAPRTLPSRETEGSAVLPSHAALLRRIAALVTRGVVPVNPVTEAHDQVVLRLLAALDADAPDVHRPADRAFVAALDDIVAAFAHLTESGARLSATHARGPTNGDVHNDILAQHDSAVLAAARARGPAAIELLHTLIARAAPDGRTASPWAGIYLLTRPIADLGLDRLAERAGVPFAPLLAALLAKLFGATPPWDAAVQLWLGAGNADPSALDGRKLSALQPLVLQALVGLRHLDPHYVSSHRLRWRDESFMVLSDKDGVCWPLAVRETETAVAELLAAWREAGADDVELALSERAPATDLTDLPAAHLLSPEVEVFVTSLATCVLHAMSRWLPGLAGSSAPFIVRNCIRRSGAVVATDDEITVTLEKGPLDIILEMAGSFAVVPETTWLGRRVRFAIAQQSR